MFPFVLTSREISEFIFSETINSSRSPAKKKMTEFIPSFLQLRVSRYKASNILFTTWKGLLCNKFSPPQLSALIVCIFCFFAINFATINYRRGGGGRTANRTFNIEKISFVCRIFLFFISTNLIHFHFCFPPAPSHLLPYVNTRSLNQLRRC